MYGEMAITEEGLGRIKRVYIRVCARADETLCTPCPPFPPCRRRVAHLLTRAHVQCADTVYAAACARGAGDDIGAGGRAERG